MKIARMFPIPTSKNRMMNTFIIVHITLTCKKYNLPCPFSLMRISIYLGTHFKGELTNLFLKVPGYSLFPHRKSRQELWTLCLWFTLTLCVRDILEDKFMLLTHFYLMQGKKKEKHVLYLQETRNTLTLNP